MGRSPHPAESHFLGCVIGFCLSVGAAVLPSACAVFEPGAAPHGQIEPTKAGSAPAATGAESGPAAVGEAGPKAAPGPIEPRIYPGTGVFIKPPAPPGPPVEITPVGDVILNFADANIREVVRSILGDTLKANYVIDAAVQGTITVQTSHPLPRSALLPTLENILGLTGAALVQAEDGYEIVPLAKAPQATRMLDTGAVRLPRGPGFGIQIVPLKFISAVEMQKILEPLAPKGSVLRVDEARNLLILGTTRRDLGILLETVEIFDVDWLSGMSFGLFPLQFTEAKTLAEDLRKILREDEKAPLTGLIRFVPIERLNSVLVISPQAAYVEKAQAWIERLDQSADGTERRLFVYYVQNGRATELAAVLNEVFTGERPAEGRPAVELAPGLEPYEIMPERAPPGGRAPKPGGTRAAQQTERPLRAGLEGAAPKAGEAITVPGKREIRIIADEANNALLILATPADYRMVKAALEKLDIVPLQVLIEATIAEVTLNDELKYGLQHFFRPGGGTTVTLSEVATGAVAQIFPGFSVFSTIAGGDVQLVLNALETVTDVKIISSPQLMVLDNQTAFIQVGDTVPFKTGEVVSDTGGVTSTFQQVDTGVILRVTPRVNAGGLVILEIEQEVSDAVATLSSGIDSPTIRQRKIKSTVAIQSGETVALGGLIKDTVSDIETGIPILSRIPVLGALFGSTDTFTKRTELLILITPRVVGSLQDARDVTEELRRRMRAVIPLRRRIE